MTNLLLFSYAMLPKKQYLPKKFNHNPSLDKKFSLTALSALETFAGYLTSLDQKIDKVIILGCHTFGRKYPADSELMARYLQKLGVPKKKILVCNQGINTVFQIEQATKLVHDNKSVYAVTLDCHKKRTEKLLCAYGFTPKMLSVEELFLKKSSRKIPNDLALLLKQFVGSKTEKSLKRESNLLLLLQIFDSKGRLQKIITKIRGIRYFDIDVSPRVADTI